VAGSLGIAGPPERVAEEYQRRLQAPASGTRQAQATIETQLGKVRQGLARLIDSYAEGLLEKHEFEPRITRLRQRIAALEEQRQQLLDEAAFQTELHLIIGRLEDFATKLHVGLDEADWLRKREMIRALVKRVEVTQDQVNVVFRVDSYPGEANPEKKVCNFVGGVRSPILSNIYMDRLDRFVQDTLIPEYTRGTRRKEGEEYRRLHSLSTYYRNTGRIERAEELRKAMQQYPSVDPNDEEYRRLRYVRYADDFLLGYAGTMAEATEIKEKIAAFLRTQLTFTLSADKTLITHASTGRARFLGYEIGTMYCPLYRTKSQLRYMIP
jgi:hypothetical protein